MARGQEVPVNEHAHWEGFHSFDLLRRSKMLDLFFSEEDEYDVHFRETYPQQFDSICHMSKIPFQEVFDPKK